VTDLTQALVDECEVQRETCEYTAVAFTIWLRWLRNIRAAFLCAPVLFGALATWKLLAQESPIMAGVCAFLAATVPLAYRALEIDRRIEAYTQMSGEFTNLRDRFRQAARVHSLKPYEQFEAEAKPWLDRMQKARQQPLTPPEFAFTHARRKIKAGHYRHETTTRTELRRDVVMTHHAAPEIVARAGDVASE